MKRIVILGGGITGLSAAFYLKRMFEGASQPIAITLLEQSERLGGKIRTLRRDGFAVEKGPDSFLARKPAIIELTQELGLDPLFVPTNPQAKKTYILKNSKLHRMPPGLVLGIPTEMAPFLKTGLISWKGKARAALDLMLPKRQDDGDESLGDFLTRRLGREVLDSIAEPLLAGIYAGDTHALSLKATFPQFHAVEQRHRSLILGMMAGKTDTPQVSAKLPAAAKNSAFLSYRTGLETLVERLVEVLDGVQLRTGVTVESVRPRPEGGCLIRTSEGETLEADGAVITLPLYTLGRLLDADGSMPAVQRLAATNYVSVANIIMGFERSAISQPLDGSGFVIPRSEKRFITACTWTSSKWKHTAPEDKVLIRCYVGRSGEEQWTDMTDEQIVDKVRSDVRELMGIDAQPLFAEVTRLYQSMPQYPVGHLDNIKQAREELAGAIPGVFMTGAGFHGVGLPDCIRQAKETAKELFSFLAAL